MTRMVKMEMPLGTFDYDYSGRGETEPDPDHEPEPDPEVEVVPDDVEEDDGDYVDSDSQRPHRSGVF